MAGPSNSLLPATARAGEAMSVADDRWECLQYIPTIPMVAKVLQWNLAFISVAKRVKGARKEGKDMSMKDIDISNPKSLAEYSLWYGTRVVKLIMNSCHIHLRVLVVFVFLFVILLHMY